MPRIYCIEGHADYQPDGVWEAGSLVQGMLQAVQDGGGLPFTRRDSPVLGAMHFWLGRDWSKEQDDGTFRPREAGSVLYFSTHGQPGQIWLSDGWPSHVPQVQAISTLPDIVGEGFARRCLVHLGGCSMVQRSERGVRKFMERSGASAVSGFTQEVNYLGMAAPALALEGNYFSELSDVNLATLHQPVNGEAGRERMRVIAAQMQASFPDCGFKLWLRTPDGIE